MNSSICSRKSQKLGRQLRSGRISLKGSSKDKGKLRKAEKNQKFEISEELNLPSLGENQSPKGPTTQESNNENSDLDEIIEKNISLQLKYLASKEKTENDKIVKYDGENDEREEAFHHFNAENDEIENYERSNNASENDRENVERENDYGGPLERNIEYSDEDRDVSLDGISVVSDNQNRSDNKFFEKEKRTERLVGKVTGLEKRITCIEKELKDIKTLVKYRAAKSPSILTYYEDETNFTLLPKIPLIKKKHVRNIDNSINTDETFKKQLVRNIEQPPITSNIRTKILFVFLQVKKLAIIGGASIKDNVIRIFKRLFSAKLRSQMCWNGTSQKEAFCTFTGVLEVLLLAVTYNFSHCTEDDIEEECKLRFKQAKKDHQREKEKLIKIEQRKLRQEREENEKRLRRQKRRERQQH